jgi:hypothetical protein
MVTISTLESARHRRSPSTCPHCGQPLKRGGLTQILETVLGSLAGLAMMLILIPLALNAWKSCDDIFSNDDSRSVIFHPLEDWTHY